MVDYAEIARKLRIDTLDLIHKGQTSHIASCFSLADIVAVLYENQEPEDRVIWSKGWASALFYSVQARDGKIDKEDLLNTFPNYPYNALLEPTVPGIYLATGSVGHGLSFGVGMAKAKKLKGEKGTVYVLMSDGELNEGSVWEASMFAKHHKLDNLLAIVDKNSIQAMGNTKDIIDLEPEKVFKGFGWLATTINGHNYQQLESSLTYQQGVPLPWAIIAETTKGKGVSFMEGMLLYHYKNIEDDVYQKALAELQ